MLLFNNQGHCFLICGPGTVRDPQDWSGVYEIKIIWYSMWKNDTILKFHKTIMRMVASILFLIFIKY